jgi:hypothetical protein
LVVVEPGLGERLGAVGVVAQLHDLALAQREDREQLAVELYAGELLAGVVADAEHGVVVVGQKLERVDLRRLGGRGAQPGEHLLAAVAGESAGDIDPDHIRVEAVGDRVDRAGRSASIQSSRSCRLACACSWFIVSPFGL